MKKNILLTCLVSLFLCLCTIAFSQTSLLDPSFGINGIVKADMDSVFNHAAYGRQVLAQSDGSIYLVFEEARVTLIAKKHADGSADLTYGVNGISAGAPIYSSYAALQADGKIIIAGEAKNPTIHYNETDFAVARFNTDGSLDNTFDADGIQVTDLSGTDVVNALKIQNDGKILLAGVSYTSGEGFIALARYNINGSLDNSFGGYGTIVSSFGPDQTATSADIQQDGKIVVGGYVQLDAVSNSLPAIIRYNTDGSPDLTFNGTAMQFLDFSPGSLAIQADGKIVAGGNLYNNSNLNFELARLNPDGSLDNTFNGTGRQTTDFGGNDDTAKSIIIQSDGKILQIGNSEDFEIARYNTDGTPDNTFNGNGKQTTDFGSSNDYANSITVQGDGKIVAVGSTVNGVNTYAAVARYNTAGTPDNSFDQDGMLVYHIRQGDTHFTATVIQSDGKIVSVGYSWNGNDYDFAIIRLNIDGSFDNTFSNDGKQLTHIGSSDSKARAVALQRDGKIVVAGSAGDRFGVVRYNTDGTLDNTFDGDGLVTTAFGSANFANALVIQNDGKILVGGSAFARYNTNGSLDLSFDGDGILITDTYTNFNPCNSLALQQDGKFIAAGGSGEGTIARYNANGSLDGTFGDNGISHGGFDSNFTSVEIQNDGKIVVGGSLILDDFGYTDAFMLKRLNVDGSYDLSFGTNGSVTTFVGGHSRDYGTSLAVQADNKIILAGIVYNGSSDNFALARYNTDGSLDNTFSGDGIEITKASPAYNGIAGIALADNILYAAGYGQYPGNFGVVAKYLFSTGNPLAVTFVDFTAELKNTSVLLQWQTASEHNLSRFIIERSAEGNTFSPIANVAATGNSNIKINYTTFDRQPLKGINFYRLKFIDTDEKFKYSKIVTININQAFNVKIFPNPASNILFVQASGENEKTSFQIIDAAGNKLIAGEIILNGNTSFPIHINTLSKGVYILKLYAKTKTKTIRFIKE